MKNVCCDKVEQKSSCGDIEARKDQSLNIDILMRTKYIDNW